MLLMKQFKFKIHQQQNPTTFYSLIIILFQRTANPFCLLARLLFATITIKKKPLGHVRP